MLHLLARNSLNAALRLEHEVIDSALEPPESGSIRAYPKESGVAPGETLTLCVSCDAPTFWVSFYRQRTTLRREGLPTMSFAGRYARFAGDDVAFLNLREPALDLQWPEYAVPIPQDCPGGVYLAVFSSTDAAPPEELPTESYFPSNAALFVVRPRPDRLAGRAQRPLYRIPIFTYHAYNAADARYGFENATFYTGASTLSLRRPGGGAGAVPWDAFNADVYDTRTPRQTFAHWDAKFIAWACARGIELDFCTDLDLHRYGIALLERYALAISAGHDEYWSDEMYAAQELYRSRGGNLAYFGANTAWRRVRVSPDDSITLEGLFGGEERLTGLTFAQGGGRWRGPRPAAGYTVRQAAHWVFAGSELRDGQTFAGHLRLVGYESDGPSEASPPALTVLADCDLAEWETADPAEGEVYGAKRAAMAIYEAGGCVFNAGTTDWPRCLALDAAVERVTVNVIERLSQHPLPSSPLIALSAEQRLRDFSTYTMPPAPALGTIDEVLLVSAQGSLPLSPQAPLRVAPSDSLAIRGWAFDDSLQGHPAPCSGVAALLAGAILVPGVYGKPRSDIVTAFADPTLRCAGYTIHVPSATLAGLGEGSHQLVILAFSASGASVARLAPSLTVDIAPSHQDRTPSPFDRRRWAAHLALTAGRRFAKALLLGDDLARLSERVAPLCDHLVTIERSDAAAKAALAAAELAGQCDLLVYSAPHVPAAEEAGFCRLLRNTAAPGALLIRSRRLAGCPSAAPSSTFHSFHEALGGSAAWKHLTRVLLYDLDGTDRAAATDAAELGLWRFDALELVNP
jgi:hypothetical protein